MSISGNKSNIFSVSWPGTRRACSTRLKSRSFLFSPYRELELTSQLPPLFAYIPSGVVETRQAHLPEVEWNTRALLNACLKPFTRWSLGYSRAVLIELTSCLAFFSHREMVYLSMNCVSTLCLPWRNPREVLWDHFAEKGCPRLLTSDRT